MYVLLVHLFVCFAHVSFCSFFSSSWCQGLAAVCDCGTPWIFLLTFFYNFGQNSIQTDEMLLNSANVISLLNTFAL